MPHQGLPKAGLKQKQKQKQKQKNKKTKKQKNKKTKKRQNLRLHETTKPPITVLIFKTLLPTKIVIEPGPSGCIMEHL
ncbi:hypothetical protein [Serratia nevei]|uniref:hypothetical protein n=1 Tax=Serratia nevei TaxID=2703794 RepID=UPI00255046BF|nr:hypothetical protein [Serratia nevei]MEC5659183.1 hypothetical protein [Serratia nevei]